MHPLDAYFGTVVLNQTSGYICRINAACLHDEYPVAFMKLQGKGIRALCSSAVYCVSFQDVPSMTFRDQECVSTQQNLGWRGSFLFFSLFFRFLIVRVHISADDKLVLSGCSKFVSLTAFCLEEPNLQVFVCKCLGYIVAFLFTKKLHLLVSGVL